MVAFPTQTERYTYLTEWRSVVIRSVFCFRKYLHSLHSLESPSKLDPL
jgi:hypothetical protein